MSISLILSFKKLTFALITLKIIAYLHFSTYLMCVYGGIGSLLLPCGS